MKKGIKIGISNFKELIESNNYFIDKSLLIKEFLENNEDIILISRPRKFGKTLNLSMLKYFFDIRCKEENKELFKGLKIESEKVIMKLQGGYPLIFINFSNQRHLTYYDFEEGVKVLISNLYKEHDYLLNSDKLSKFDKSEIKEIILRKASIGLLSESISNLMQYMNKHYGKKVILLIDEYDVPIQDGYLHGYYSEMIVLIRNLLISALKDKQYVEKALITGTLIVGKKNIFSELNNLEVNTILKCNFKDKFGFTEEEINDLLNYYNITENIKEIKEWYDGYVFGEKVIYNPWSLINYLKNVQEGLRPYWIDASNELIKKLLLKGNMDMKAELGTLLNGKTINKVIDDNIVMSEIEWSNDNIWNLLLMSGYLKAVKIKNIEGKVYCDLKIPNKEVFIFYKNLIKKWFQETMTNEKYEEMINNLINGNVKEFSYNFEEFVANNISYFDVSQNESEKLYYSFILGIQISLSNTHEVRSNKESTYEEYSHITKQKSKINGLGIMIIPKNTSKPGIVIEFKGINNLSNETMEEGISKVLIQLDDMKYSEELVNRGIEEIIKLAIVFKGKEVKIVWRNK